MSRIEYSLPFDSRAFRRTHMDLDAHETVANFHRFVAKFHTVQHTKARGENFFWPERVLGVELEGKRDGFFLKTPKKKEKKFTHQHPSAQKKRKNSSLLKLPLNTQCDGFQLVCLWIHTHSNRKAINLCSFISASSLFVISLRFGVKLIEERAWEREREGEREREREKEKEKEKEKERVRSPVGAERFWTTAWSRESSKYTRHIFERASQRTRAR